MPGTTRDAIHVPFERNGKHFELIDTAGLRRKGKVFEAIEKFSVVKTLQAIADANVVVLMVDATQGVSDQDAHIAGYILESGRAVVIAVNKWDAVDAYQREMFNRSLEQRMAFLRFARCAAYQCHQACRTGAAVEVDCRRARPRPPARCPPRCSQRLVQEAVEHQAPRRAGMFRPKLRYAHQGGMNPPIVGGARQRAGTHHRHLQALPGRPHPRPLQAGGHPRCGWK